MIVLLLLLSGDVQSNPGPELQCIQTPADFKSGLKFVHLRHGQNADIVIISETWLTKSITNKDISILRYNVYRADRPKKGGGVAILFYFFWRTTLFLFTERKKSNNIRWK